MTLLAELNFSTISRLGTEIAASIATTHGRYVDSLWKPSGTLRGNLPI